MIKWILSLSLLGLLASCGEGFEEESTPTQGQEQESYEDTLSTQLSYLEALNQHRANLGLRDLALVDAITKEATGHSKGMALRTRPFGHSGLRIRCKRIRNLMGLRRGVACAEVVAEGQRNQKELLKAWLNSPAHRETLESEGFTHTGLGKYVADNGTIYWTQIFISDE